ncbi:hypothetical protein [Streptomyces sp. Ru71]|nr:hypothetical protein [Streptomyces sp. Ru71]
MAAHTDRELVGSGSPLRGAAQDLLLVAFGRRLAAGRLDGPEVHRFVTA